MNKMLVRVVAVTLAVLMVVSVGATIIGCLVLA